jgi:hypothetical protein
MAGEASDPLDFMRQILDHTGPPNNLRFLDEKTGAVVFAGVV